MNRSNTYSYFISIILYYYRVFFKSFQLKSIIAHLFFYKITSSFGAFVRFLQPFSVIRAISSILTPNFQGYKYRAQPSRYCPNEALLPTSEKGSAFHGFQCRHRDPSNGGKNSPYPASIITSLAALSPSKHLSPLLKTPEMQAEPSIRCHRLFLLVADMADRNRPCHVRMIAVNNSAVIHCHKIAVLNSFIGRNAVRL